MPKSVQEKVRGRETEESVTQEFPVRDVGEVALDGEVTTTEVDVLDIIDGTLQEELDRAKRLNELLADIALILPEDSQAVVDSYRQVNGQ